jgi:hypothetical protein
LPSEKLDNRDADDETFKELVRFCPYYVEDGTGVHTYVALCCHIRMEER